MKRLVLLVILLLCASFITAQEKDESILLKHVNVLTEQYALEGGIGSFDLTLPAGTQSRGVYVGSDVNQNGLYEIILTSYTDGGKVHVFEISGDNTATEIWTSPNIGSSSSSSVRGVQVADLDGNGDFELVLSVNGNGGTDDAVGGLLIYEYSLATTSWDAAYHTVIDSGALTGRWNIEGFDIYDVDGDGQQEVLISNNGLGSFDSCYVISFTGTFDGGATQVTEFGWGKNGTPALGGSAMNAYHGDLDGDGNMEALFGIWDNCAILIAEATDTNTYAFRQYIKMDLTGGDAVPLDNIVSYDLDNDGRDELYATLYSGGGAGSLMGLRCVTEFDSMTQANSVFQIAGPGASGSYGIEIGDVDGDGDMSIYTAGYTAGTIVNHEYNGGDITDPANYTATTFATHATAIGSFGLDMSPVDMDGDGYNELVVSYVDGTTPIHGTAYEYTPVITTFPYFEAFENGGSIPTDWENDGGDSGENWLFGIPDGSGDPAAYGATADHTTGTGYLAWVNDSSPHTTPTNMISPPLDLTALTAPRLKFYYWIGTGSPDNSSLVIDVYNGTTWTNDLLTVTNNDQWDLGVVDLTPYQSAATKVRFRAMENIDFDSDITLDDVTIEEAPTTPILNVSADTVNFGVGNVSDTTAFVSITVQNLGVGTLTLSGVGLVDATDFILADTNVYPIGLTSLQSISFDVAFAPVDVGEKATNLDITYSTTEDVFSVYLSGTSINPNFGGGPADPVSGGYYFANSTPAGLGWPVQPTFNWVDISATGTSALGDLNDDNIGGPYPIGFTFNYFGVDYTQFWISSNGWISFEDNATATSTQQRTNTVLPNILPPQNAVYLLWDDLNPDDADVPDRELLYGNDPGGDLIVSLINYPEFGATVDGWITAQIILKQNGNIKLQYSDHGPSIDLTSSTIGIENADGTLGLQYHFNLAGGPIFSSPLAVEFGPDSSQIPVELTSFAAVVNERDVILTWETATEVNSDKYIIQRQQKDAAEWTAIGELKSAGNSTERQSYSFTDARLNSSSYNYRLKMIDFDGSYEFSSVVEVTIGLPTVYALSQNYPNPFNPSTKIEYALPSDSKVKLELYSITGERVAELLNQDQAAGYHSVDLNISNISNGLASGMYIYRIVAVSNTDNKNFVSVKKMMLLK